MEPKQYYIGIDVGGTSVKEGLFDEDGNCLANGSVPTPPIVDAAGFAAVTEAIDQVVAKAQIPRAFVAGIGLAVPCPIPASGDAKVKANIAINLPELRVAIQKHCPDAVVKYENDANAAAMGEAWLGSAKGVQNVVMVTIGTGVGGGVIVNGDVVSGVVGAGGEIGHMCLNPDEERTCGCGGHGHLEQYSSATGVVSNYLAECKKAGVEPIELTGPSDSKDVFQACREGDKLALAAADTMADYLGRALALIANVVDPEMFLIGGGASASADVYLDKVREHFKQYALSASRETPIKVRFARKRRRHHRCRLRSPARRRQIAGARGPGYFAPTWCKRDSLGLHACPKICRDPSVCEGSASACYHSYVQVHISSGGYPWQTFLSLVTRTPITTPS